MRRVKWFLLAMLIGCAAWCAAQKPATQHAPDNTAEAWQKEFDDICSKTQDAMSLSVDELKTLVQRCDALVQRLEKLDETRKKVYLRRLQQCRGLFAYVLESKRETQKKDKS